MELLFKTFPNVPFWHLLHTIRKLLVGCESVLDVGCGPRSPLSYLNFKFTVGLEGYKPNITLAKKNKTHDKYIYTDMRNLLKIAKHKSFDAVVALDVIEHLSKKDGYKLIKEMEYISRKKVLIFTPNGFMVQHSNGKNLEEHLSGWSPDDFKRLGYEVIGFYGLKFLRDEKYSIRFRPKYFWAIISELSNFVYARNNPAQANSLLCLKNT